MIYKPTDEEEKASDRFHAERLSQTQKTIAEARDSSAPLKSNFDQTTDSSEELRIISDLRSQACDLVDPETDRPDAWTANLLRKAANIIEGNMSRVRASLPQPPAGSRGETVTLSLPHEITIKLSSREDGGLRICSDDLPGLILSSKDIPAILRDLPKAIAALLDHNGFHGLGASTPAQSGVVEARQTDELEIAHNRLIVAAYSIVDESGTGAFSARKKQLLETAVKEYQFSALAAAQKALATPSNPAPVADSEELREILAQEYERAGYGKQYTDRMVRCIKPDSPNPPPAEIQIALAAMSRVRSTPSMQTEKENG